jgi:hypothetical protein
MALLPFTVTAQTGPLGWIDGLLCQEGLDGCPQSFSWYRKLMSWPTRGEVSALAQCALAIKEAKVRSARSGRGVGHD